MFGVISAGSLPFIIIGLIILWNSINILPEYERGVVFRLGRITGARGPGLILVIPGLERMVRVDLRTITHDVPVQEVITKDNVPCKVNAVCYFKVLDPVKAVVEVMNYAMATSQIAQTTLRSVLGQVDFDELLSHREKINTQLQHIIDQQTDPWGIKVSIVEVKDVQVPEQMQRAMAHQAEAERNRRAKVITAQGEFEASQKISEAARIIASEPSALQLRFLQTAQEIGASDRTTTLILPIPMEMLKFMEGMSNKAKN
jgi:regulator of protease activity HflC (stomatin/prohibitin superfamily)